MVRMVMGATVGLISSAAAFFGGLPFMPMGGPPPAARPAVVVAAHERAKSAVDRDIAPAHRDKVRGIVDAFDAGNIATANDAAGQIDAVLSMHEIRALLADQQRLRAAQLAAGPSQTGPRVRTSDVGRFVLRMDATPGALRVARAAGPHPGTASLLGL